MWSRGGRGEEGKDGGSLRENLKGSAGSLVWRKPKLRESTSLEVSPRSGEQWRVELEGFAFEDGWVVRPMVRGREGLKRFGGVG